MKLSLPDSVASVQDLAELADELHQYERWFARNAIKKQLGAVKHKSEPPILSQGASQLLRELEIEQSLSSAAISQLIESVDKYATSAPTINFILAAPASNPLKHSIVRWCRQNLSADILVNFQFNRSILGGAVVRYGSHIFDWSFRRKVLGGRDHFLEVLDSVR